ncbi:hypothetical protein SAMN05660662_1280 [Blastococcus aurantiacus]|uniref:EfeO-type cupredoxin-like domain-containing protein n=1 Tax=Blastococcus aurantiacus TaxID=1550231 RepID=A0A1G7J365_9ACTN|nr:hypothetical protein [Blastococcus aurantiacus]SDF19331.1 hypothetical protein SAMN05660662_1280 [Blastococcus aurantiacus]
MTARPVRLPRAVAASAVALVLPLAACAGTDEPRPSAASSSSSSTSSSSTSSSTSSSAAGAGAASSSPGQGSLRAELDVVAGPVEQAGRISVRVGESVTLVLNSTIDDELHVHGYDLTADLRAGQTTELTFDATIPGVFEIELHDAGTVLLTLQVS